MLSGDQVAEYELEGGSVSYCLKCGQPSPGAEVWGVVRCELESCVAEATELVNHPERPEELTQLCGHHAECAREAGAEVVSS